ncbi:MAG TPA: MEDS domain-containing protein [Acidimicrobiales bacterium]|nr:MEDS domain-containing protein [Acidimicrobiales bacterium]
MTTTAAVPAQLCQRSVSATEGHQHLVEFYESDAYLAGAVASFLEPGFAEPGAVIVVATPGHRSAFETALAASGVDIFAAAADGRYVSFDAATLLARLLADGVPDAGAFSREVGGLLEGMAIAGRRLRIYGEMVALLWEAGNAASAVALEDLWNELASSYDFELLCAYRLTTFDNESDALAFRRVCEQHEARPEQVLLAELAYADALTTVINRQSATLEGPAARTRRQRGSDTLALATWRSGTQLMASPGGRVLGGIAATEVAEAPFTPSH